jgi:hypothetical protein
MSLGIQRMEGVKSKIELQGCRNAELSTHTLLGLNEQPWWWCLEMDCM